MSWLRNWALVKETKSAQRCSFLSGESATSWSRVARRVRAIAVMTSELACGQVGPFHMQVAARPSPGQLVCE